MDKKPKQKMRFTDEELELIKSHFAENEELLKAIRKVFLQLPLEVSDKEILVGHFKSKPESLKLLKKTLNPELDPNAPFHQLIDLWLSVDIKDRPIGDLLPVFQSRELLIKILDQQLEVFKSVINKETPEYSSLILLDELTTLKDKSAEEFFVGLTARNTLITHIDTQLMQLEILGGLKEETMEQTKEKLLKNSNK